jgi:hypothetical protein
MRFSVKGRITAMRRSGYGLHVVLYCRFLAVDGKPHRDLRWAPCLCRDETLSQRMERFLEVNDLVTLRGLVAPCDRPVCALVAHKWDLLVTEAQIPLCVQVRRMLRVGSPSDRGT